jgi:hypothetical protein
VGQTTRRQRVAAALASIREFHALGKRLPKRASHKEAYDKGLIDDAAAKLGMNPDAARKARQFADAVEGYSAAELNELCRLIGRVQPAQDDAKAVFSRTHVIRLLTVPKPDRARLQAAAVEKGWSVSRLEAEIATRYGTRRAGGRSHRVPQDALGLLVRAEHVCESWRRWFSGVEAAEAKGAKQAGRARLLIDELPKKVVSRLRSAEAAVAALHRAVADELGARKPGVSVRHRFRSKGA